jgi:hypothetical protein
MKTLTTKMLAGLIIVTVGFQSCGNSKRDKFFGTWQKISKTDSEIMTIGMDQDAIIVQTSKKDSAILMYDAKHDVLKFYFFSKPTVVKYNQKNGHLVISDEGEYKKIN